MGQRAGVGEASRAAAGTATAGEISTTTRFGRKRKKSAGEGGGEKSRAQAGRKDKASEIPRDVQTLAKWHPDHVTHAVLLNKLRLRKGEWVWSNGQEVACLRCARSRRQFGSSSQQITPALMPSACCLCPAIRDSLPNHKLKIKTLSCSGHGLLSQQE